MPATACCSFSRSLPDPWPGHWIFFQFICYLCSFVTWILYIVYSSTWIGRTPSWAATWRVRHVIKVQTHLNVKLPAIGGHLPNADADSHLLVVRTCYNGQCKQMPRFRWSFQPKIAHGAHPNLRPTVCSNVHAAIWWPQAIFHIESPAWWTTWLWQFRPFWLHQFYDITS